MVTASKPRKKAAAKKKTTAKKSTVPSRKKAASGKAKAKAKAPAKRKKGSKKKETEANTQSRRISPLWRKRGVRAIKISAVIAAALIVATFLWALAYRWVNPPRTPLMISRALFDGAATNIEWRALDEIAPDMTLAIIAAEDQRFFTHRGFDFVEIQRAWEASQDGGRLRGASTLSQQTAKNVFLLPTRSWIRKGLEVYFTGLIEVLWGKERILEVYMNVAETGPGIYGVEAASTHYFDRSSSSLTRQQAASIAAVLPNPRERFPDAPSQTVAKRRDWILGQMRNLGGTAYLAPLER